MKREKKRGQSRLHQSDFFYSSKTLRRVVKITYPLRSMPAVRRQRYPQSCGQEEQGAG